MRQNVLLNKVYSKLHKALFTLNSTNIGISFPAYELMLGDIIRLHGDKDSLAALQQTNWLGGLIGYCEVSVAKTIPNQVLYRTVSRKQSNMTEAKLRRLIKRGSISNDDIKSYKAKMFAQGLDDPYLELESASNGYKHRRYIQFGQCSQHAQVGIFDQFGLSKTATVPWF